VVSHVMVASDSGNCCTCIFRALLYELRDPVSVFCYFCMIHAGRSVPQYEANLKTIGVGFNNVSASICREHVDSCMVARKGKDER